MDSKLKQEENDLAFLLNNESGLRFLKRLIVDECGVLQLSINFNSKRISEFSGGQRAIGLKLLDEIGQINETKALSIFKGIFKKEED
jgi:hypothetical protein